LADVTQWPFWVAVGQIIWINILLSGDNAVVIALACRSLPAKQRFWGILLGAGAAVLLRILFTLVIAQIMSAMFLKLVGGLLLLWIAIKLVVPSEEHGEGNVKAGDTLWRAVWLVTVADIVMSLDNVIAIAGGGRNHRQGCRCGWLPRSGLCRQNPPVGRSGRCPLRGGGGVADPTRETQGRPRTSPDHRPAGAGAISAPGTLAGC
jgi:YjbE family integral membrane protein